jgi:hypothetical protein
MVWKEVIYYQDTGYRIQDTGYRIQDSVSTRHYAHT